MEYKVVIPGGKEKEWSTDSALVRQYVASFRQECPELYSRSSILIRRGGESLQDRVTEHNLDTWFKSNQYVIRKTPAGKKTKYEVFHHEGFKVGQRLSTREYVACLVDERDQRKISLMPTWFGRIGLIGKGDSRHYVGVPGIVIAYLE